MSLGRDNRQAAAASREVDLPHADDCLHDSRPARGRREWITDYPKLHPRLWPSVRVAGMGPPAPGLAAGCRWPWRWPTAGPAWRGAALAAQCARSCRTARWLTTPVGRGFAHSRDGPGGMFLKRPGPMPLKTGSGAHMGKACTMARGPRRMTRTSHALTSGGNPRGGASS